MNRQQITSVSAWEALDSRGRPTVGCESCLASVAAGNATVPSGASTGSYEARELRDGGDRYGGFGVRTAVTNVIHQIGPEVIGMDATDQAKLDAILVELDGTPSLG